MFSMNILLYIVWLSCNVNVRNSKDAFDVFELSIIEDNAEQKNAEYINKNVDSGIFTFCTSDFEFCLKNFAYCLYFDSNLTNISSLFRILCMSFVLDLFFSYSIFPSGKNLKYSSKTRFRG